MKKLIGEIKKQTLALFTAAFAFVAGLIWRDAVMEWLQPVLAGEDGGAMTLTIVALAVTIIAVVVTIVLTKLLGEEEKK